MEWSSSRKGSGEGGLPPWKNYAIIGALIIVAFLFGRYFTLQEYDYPARCKANSTTSPHRPSTTTKPTHTKTPTQTNEESSWDQNVTDNRKWAGTGKLPAEYYKNAKPERFGGAHTGWNLYTKGFNEETIVYGVGVGEDMTFEIGLVRKYNVTTYSFDPTPKAANYIRNLAETDPEVASFIKMGKINFFPFGLHSKDSFLPFHLPKNSKHVSGSIFGANHLKGDAIWAPVFRLRTILENLQHDHIDVLKIDIEGSEFPVVEELGTMDDIPVDQLLIELHGRFFPKNGNELVGRLKKTLQGKGYKPFYNYEDDLGLIKTDLL